MQNKYFICEGYWPLFLEDDKGNISMLEYNGDWTDLRDNYNVDHNFSRNAITNVKRIIEYINNEGDAKYASMVLNFFKQEFYKEVLK